MGLEVFDRFSTRAIVKEHAHPSTGPFTLLSAGNTWTTNSNVEEVHGYALVETQTRFPNKQTVDEIAKVARERVPQDRFVFVKDNPSTVTSRGIRPRMLVHTEYIRDNRSDIEMYGCWNPHPQSVSQYKDTEVIGFAELPQDVQGFSDRNKLDFESKVEEKSLNAYWEAFR